MTDSVADAKEGLVVSCVDTIETYRQQVWEAIIAIRLLHNISYFNDFIFQASMSIPTGLLISQSLRLLPLYVLACLRSVSTNIIADEF